MAPKNDKETNGETFGQAVDRLIAAMRSVRRIIGSSPGKKISVVGLIAAAYLFGNTSGATNGSILDWRSLLLGLAGVPTSTALVGAAGPTEPAPERHSILSVEGEADIDDVLEMFDEVDDQLAEGHAHDYKQDQKIDGLQQAIFAHEQRDLDLRERQMDQNEKFMQAINDLSAAVVARDRIGRNIPGHTPPLTDPPDG